MVKSCRVPSFSFLKITSRVVHKSFDSNDDIRGDVNGQAVKRTERRTAVDYRNVWSTFAGVKQVVNFYITLGLELLYTLFSCRQSRRTRFLFVACLNDDNSVQEQQNYQRVFGSEKHICIAHNMVVKYQKQPNHKKGTILHQN